MSLETLKQPQDVNVFIDAHSLDLKSLQQNVSSHTAKSSQRQLTRHSAMLFMCFSNVFLGTLLIIDSLNSLLQLPNAPEELAGFLSSLITPSTSLLAAYHVDVPVTQGERTYNPPPLTLLNYLATSILTLHSLSHLVAAKRARLRSIAIPEFGLAEEKEGIIAGLGCNDPRGTVIELEYRRKSGRAVHEVFFLPSRSSSGRVESPSGSRNVVLLENHPAYKLAGTEEGNGGATTSTAAGEEDEPENTFNLSLTDKQRRDREGVVLPYFDAQSDTGVGQGGRILYDMGVEDDFDEEEDEI